MFVPLGYDPETNTIHIKTPAGLVILPFNFAQDMFIQGTAFTIGVTRKMFEVEKNGDVVADVERFLHEDC